MAKRRRFTPNLRRKWLLRHLWVKVHKPNSVENTTSVLNNNTCLNFADFWSKLALALYRSVFYL